jgi:hypothetical protein
MLLMIFSRKSALGEAKAALKDSESTDNLELKESKRKGA